MGNHAISAGTQVSSAQVPYGLPRLQDTGRGGLKGLGTCQGPRAVGVGLTAAPSNSGMCSEEIHHAVPLCHSHAE